MFEDVERLKVVMMELGETISQPNTLPVAAKEFVEVCTDTQLMCSHVT